MPLCPTCDNRPFATKEALLQHVRTSSNPHPFCLTCDRRFSSELAFNAHMAAKHPPTFDCLKCEKQYSSLFALEGHYRGHIDHPNCPVCGKGFYDNVALAAHARETHNDLWCNTCNLRFESIGAANEHYLTSPAHPNCGACGVGLRDLDALGRHVRLHESSANKGRATPPDVNGHGEADTPTLSSPPFKVAAFHSPPASVVSTTFSPVSASFHPQPLPGPPLQPTVQSFVSSPPLGFVGVGAQPARNGSTTSFGGTGFSPLSPKHNIFNKDLRRVAAIDTTLRVDSPDIPHLANLQSSPLLNVQAPVFSPVGLPRPGKQIDELWSSKENIQVHRNRLPRQPIFQPSGSILPPQTWNTAPSGPTGVNSIPSQQLVPLPSYRFQTMAPRHRASSDTGDTATPIVRNFPHLNGSNQDTSAVLEPWFGATRQEYNFNPKLYHGSARSLPAQSAPNGPGSPPIASGHPGSTNPTTNTVTIRPPQSLTLNPSFDFSFRQQPPSLLSLPLPFSQPAQQNSVIRTSPPQLPHQDILKEGVPKANGLRHATIIEEKPDKSNFHDDISMPSAVSTPRFASSDIPLHDFRVQPVPSTQGELPSPSDFSTDFSTVSSMSSIARMSSPTFVHERRRGPSRSRSRAASSVRSEISPLNIPSYKITESSQRPSPVSPDVISPVGLAALPGISPLGPSPIDLDTSFDIPEAQHPLPDSIPPSPFAFGELLDTPEQEQYSAQPMADPRSRSASVLGLHQDNDFFFTPARESDSDGFVNTPLGPSPPSSPKSFVTSHEEPPEKKSEVLSVDVNFQSKNCSRVASPRNTRLHGVEQEEVPCAETNLVVKSPSPTPSRTSDTPRAEDENVPLSQVTSINLDVGLSKLQRLVAPSLGVTPNISIASTAPSEGIGRTGSFSGLPSLHCRACRRDTADDITATMCGHVFCNRCIVDAVIKTSRCPFCSTPTLLYCLFRLDLAT